MAVLAMGAIVAALAVTVFASSASALSTTYKTVYNNIPNPQPGKVPSVGFVATSTSEFGGQIGLAGTARRSPRVTVLMSSWGCQSGHWYSEDCQSAPRSKFSHPITFNVYDVNNDDSPGALLASVTGTFNMPYRPSANNTHCTGSDAGKWWHRRSDTCFNGKAFKLTASLGSTGPLPDKVIVSIAYDTTHYGDSPVGESAPCYTSSGGCPYDALNVGLDGAPSVGTQPLPDDAYLDSTWGGAYCDGGSGGTGTFRLDAGCWTGFQPAFQVRAR
jgi:hypothetical protein